jgi:hypothetical protein
VREIGPAFACICMNLFGSCRTRDSAPSRTVRHGGGTAVLHGGLISEKYSAAAVARPGGPELLEFEVPTGNLNRDPAARLGPPTVTRAGRGGTQLTVRDRHGP